MRSVGFFNSRFSYPHQCAHIHKTAHVRGNYILKLGESEHKQTNIRRYAKEDRIFSKILLNIIKKEFITIAEVEWKRVQKREWPSIE